MQFTKFANIMLRLSYIICLLIVCVVEGIMHPVYKIAVTQKGYAQFIEYDVETPPIKEFTFCMWVRVFNFDDDQTIFSYVGKGNKRAAKLWLEAGGANLRVLLNYKVSSRIPVDWKINIWTHVCMSYQSSYGAWAVYIDGRLEQCEVTRSLQGYALPGNGSIIIGYGITEDSSQNGLEGEIFGFYMILASTIEGNLNTDLQYQQKPFTKKKFNGDTNFKYIVLGDLATAKTVDVFQGLANNKLKSNRHKSFIRVSTPFSNVDHDVGIDISMEYSKNNKHENSVKVESMEIVDYLDSLKNTDLDVKVNYWKEVRETNKGKYNKSAISLFPASTHLSTENYPLISVFETPPPPPQPQSHQNLKEISMADNSEQLHKKNFNVTKLKLDKKIINISDIETPPPLQKFDNVYGQWASYNYPGNVLNYLKNVNSFKKDLKKVPVTIPLTKNSDSYPYSSSFKVASVKPFQIHRSKVLSHHYNIKKRDTKNTPEINVQIENNDLREEILKSHAQTQAINVKIINRGETSRKRELRNINGQLYFNNTFDQNYNTPRPFKHKHNHRLTPSNNILKTNKIISVHSPNKILDYNLESVSNENSDDMYIKSLSRGNKWHNVKSYSNDYSPRNIPTLNNLEKIVAEANRRPPTIRLNYQHESNLHYPNNLEHEIIRGRELANAVAGKSNALNQERLVNLKSDTIPFKYYNKIIKEDSFNKNVKIGNALKEGLTIGLNKSDTERSFVGGNDRIPDINRYRSDIDEHVGNSSRNVPPSLGPKVCISAEFNLHTLYVKPDGTIDTTNIVSPIKLSNLGIMFISQNYKKCLLDGTAIQENPLIFIDWSRTPVRLFGGAYPKKAKNLCGFF